jgi:hypothetical protein
MIGYVGLKLVIAFFLNVYGNVLRWAHGHAFVVKKTVSI